MPRGDVEGEGSTPALAAACRFCFGCCLCVEVVKEGTSLWGQWASHRQHDELACSQEEHFGGKPFKAPRRLVEGGAPVSLLYLTGQQGFGGPQECPVFASCQGWMQQEFCGTDVSCRAQSLFKYTIVMIPCGSLKYCVKWDILIFKNI